MSLKVIANPRFWGPCDPADAVDLVEDVLNAHHTTETLRLFAIGEIDPQELSYRIQTLFEAFEERRRRAAMGEGAMDREGKDGVA